MAADVPERKDYASARIRYGEKVARQMANGKNFTGNLEVTAPDEARGAQASMNLRSFEERCMQVGMILLQCGELQLQLGFACLIT
jgi:hypothetical protein